MKRFTFKSIRSRLTYWFLLLTLIPLIIVLIITYFQRVSYIQTRTFDKLTAIRDLKVERLNDWLAERVGDMNTISADNELNALEKIINKTSFNQNDNKTLENSRQILNRYLKNYPAYNELFIINPVNGKILVSTKEYLEGRDKSTDEYFTKPMQSRKLSIKDIYYSQTSSAYSMDYSIPIFCNRHAGKHIVGILVARIDLHNSLFNMLLERVGLGKTGETLIVNKDAVALNELRWYDNAPLSLKISAEPAVNAARGETGIAVTTDYHDEDVLAAYTYIPETGWGFVCKQDLYELNAPIREMVWNFIIIFIITSIVIALIAFKISQTISKPIVEIDNVAQKIGAGDFSVRNTITSEDELGSLAMEFNNMADVTESRLKIQEGVADLSETMIGKSSIQEFGIALLKKLMNITEANISTFYVLNEGTSEYEHFVSVGANKKLLKPFDAKNPEGEVGNALSKKNIYYLQDIPEDTIFKYRTTAGDAIPKEIITIPILVDSTVVALISLVNIHRFSKECYEILKQSWPGINTSYSNLMVSEKTRILAEQLTKINQQLEAQTEELQDQAEELQDQAEELQRSSEEMQEQNLRLYAQRKQVEAANRLKSEFLSNMSHELRTPLNSILALSRVLIMQAKEKLNDEENNYLEIVERNGKHLLSLINDILDLSKIEAGKMEISPEFISIGSLLQIIKENMQTLLEEKGLSLTLSIPENLPQVETEESKLHQVLTNIISNAVKFTEKGSVDISVTHDPMNVFIEVKDSGIGISEEMLHHIFDEFRQADGTSSRQYEGTGLGLSIANKMTKILGGNIKVKSKLGKGSVFTVTIPIEWHEDILLTEEFSFGNKSSESMDKMILVVDDDPKIVKDISEYLNEAGYKTMGATSGKEALELAENYQPFAITLDIIMPEMDGWEVLQKLKTNARTKNIPVIIVSVSNDKDTGFALGAVGYINKPVDKDLLILEIKTINKTPDSVMIVDDNEFELKQMTEIIEAEGINTILATGGKECIKLLEEKVPDILVLDIMMPDMDGFKVLKKIRKNPKTRDLPVIIVTAKDLTKEDKTRLIGKVSSIIAKSDTTPQYLYKEIKRIIKELRKSRRVDISSKKISETRILIVEDNQDAIIQVKTVLENKNYKVDVAGGGQEALDYLQYTIPDGIILDLMMPDIDGFEVLKKLRSNVETKAIPVLVLTAKDLTHKELVKLKANNIQQLVLKGDIDVEGLLFKVKQMLVNKPISMEGKLEEKGRKVKKAKSENTNGVIKKKKDVTNADLPNILVVEDNPDNMATINAILKGKYNIAKAVDGEQGLKMAQSQQPDLILLDMSLPKISGEEIIKVLKKNNETKHIPVIAVTAQAMKGDKERFIKAGCDGYISKPMDMEALLAEIGKFLKN